MPTSPMAEYQLHVAVADFLAYALPEKYPATHLPMGEWRAPRTAAKLKRMGVKPGWPDWEILGPNGVTIRIELKPEKGILSPAQKTFHARAKALGHPTYICRSVERIIEILEQHGIVLKARMA